MSNSGPAPYWNRNAGLGCQDSGPGVWNVVMAVSGVPMSPRSDQAPRGLQACAEEGVRGAAQADPGGVGGLEKAQPGFPVQGEGLLGPDVLAGVDGGGGHLHVGGRDGEVDDDFDVGMVQRCVHAAPLRDAVFLGAGFGGLLEEVGDDEDLQVREDREVVQVLLADVAGADDGDAHRAHGLRQLCAGSCAWPCGCCSRRSGRRGSRRCLRRCRPRSHQTPPRLLPGMWPPQ